MKLQQKGIKGKVNEVGNTSNTSSIKKREKQGYHLQILIEQRLTKKIETNMMLPTIQKLCRI